MYKIEGAVTTVDYEDLGDLLSNEYGKVMCHTRDQSLNEDEISVKDEAHKEVQSTVLTS